MTITLPGNSFNGVKALTVHPETNQLWAVLHNSLLSTIDPTTGVATVVSFLGDTTVALAFDDAGVLYGIGGPDSNRGNTQTLFVIDQTTDQRTDVFTFPTGGPHTLGFDFDSGLLFRASGRAGSPRLESLDLDSLELTDISLSESWHGEARALAFDGLGGFYLATGFKGPGAAELFYHLSTDGTATFVGQTDHRIKGLALVVSEPPPSDLTKNGFVDFDDLSILLSNWDQDVASILGNLVSPDDTPINFDDLAVLLSDWTGPAPAGSPEAALGEAAVPEPSSLLLALLATLGLSFYRQRRRRAF